ncbi:hypothetical protein [Mesorhizobium sp. M0768]|uniref:hypothetical protein n=2 Tax=Mesorhizobium TaxID=68287 RepID=UPI0033361D25
MVEGTCFTPKMSLLTRFLVHATFAACLPSASYAEPRNGPRLEEPACQPITTANEAFVKIPIFQATWDAVIKRDTAVVVMHRESVYANGILYERTAPYAPWRVEALQLGNPRHSGCHQLREEMLDGVNTVVISYWRHNPDVDPRWYHCTIWIEIPEYRNRKLDCSTVYFSEEAELKRRWFYKTDIKLPAPPQK